MVSPESTISDKPDCSWITLLRTGNRVNRKFLLEWSEVLSLSAIVIAIRDETAFRRQLSLAGGFAAPSTKNYRLPPQDCA